jgi:hypothetical protein
LLIMSLATTLVLALAIIVSAASAETFNVGWDFTAPDPLDVKVGDTLAFTWEGGFHDIYIHPTLDCTEDGAIPLYAPATQGGSSSYIFTAEDASPDGKGMFFACDIGGHCEGNVNQVVTVFPAAAVDDPTDAPVDTTIGTPAPVDTTYGNPAPAAAQVPSDTDAPTAATPEVPAETDTPTATPAASDAAAPSTIIRSIPIGLLGIFVAMATVLAF